MDLTASEEELGKPAGSDLWQGNITLPILYAMENPGLLKSKIEKVSEYTSRDEMEEIIASSLKERCHRALSSAEWNVFRQGTERFGAPSVQPCEENLEKYCKLYRQEKILRKFKMETLPKHPNQCYYFRGMSLGLAIHTYFRSGE